MKPPLHPDMGQVVICARVAIQLLRLKYNQAKYLPLTPAEYAREVDRDLPVDYSGMLPFAIHSLITYLGLGMRSQEWLQNVLEAAHYGNSFRRCFFFDYKENRRAYPPVSNTGVQTSQVARQLRIGKGRGRV